MPKTIDEKLKEGREYRRINLEDIELREGETEDEKYIVEGYATKFNNWYTLYKYGRYTVLESIDPHAFDKCDMSDVIMQYDHEGRVYARTTNATLTLTVDGVGLKIRAYLGGTAGGRQLFEEIKGKYITKMSFGFVVSTQERKVVEDEENDTETVYRTITGISKLYDVSAVSIPANDATEISSRTLGEGVIAEALQELEQAKKREEQRKKLRIMCAM